MVGWQFVRGAGSILKLRHPLAPHRDWDLFYEPTNNNRWHENTNSFHYSHLSTFLGSYPRWFSVFPLEWWSIPSRALGFLFLNHWKEEQEKILRNVTRGREGKGGGSNFFYTSPHESTPRKYTSYILIFLDFTLSRNLFGPNLQSRTDRYYLQPLP